MIAGLRRWTLMLSFTADSSLATTTATSLPVLLATSAVVARVTFYTADDEMGTIVVSLRHEPIPAKESAFQYRIIVRSVKVSKSIRIDRSCI